ncbi:MAG: exosortase B [Aquabacterium sp.]|uniref:exosortase B n=1 Tax=Aquabacterium sp. TaxID=1872578 RepID=UPI001DE5744B|nr:exosortase B [Aquabacterium sp.]MBT9609772.1 exosortase B [Aquabacterium sp.]
MTTTSEARPLSSGGLLPISMNVLVLCLGLLGMFALTLNDLLFSAQANIWMMDEHSHGPIMLALALWLMHQRWSEFEGSTDGTAPGTWVAWVMFAIAIAFYAPGRALNIIYFEVFAFIPMMVGVVAMIGGFPLLNKLKFPLFFLVFMVPIPGFVVEPISQFVKLHISIVTAEILWYFGYPIGHTGVVLSIGPYQLLVADACAGMRTLFMLEAMGIFYLNVVRHTSLLRNVALGILIVPISFVANMTRVLFLALLTYHFGDEVGQGFLHGFAGIVLFIIALVLTIAIDGLLRLVATRVSGRNEEGASA